MAQAWLSNLGSLSGKVDVLRTKKRKDMYDEAIRMLDLQAKQKKLKPDDPDSTKSIKEQLQIEKLAIELAKMKSDFINKDDEADYKEFMNGPGGMVEAQKKKEMLENRGYKEGQNKIKRQNQLDDKAASNAIKKQTKAEKDAENMQKDHDKYDKENMVNETKAITEAKKDDFKSLTDATKFIYSEIIPVAATDADLKDPTKRAAIVTKLAAKTALGTTYGLDGKKEYSASIGYLQDAIDNAYGPDLGAELFNEAIERGQSFVVKKRKAEIKSAVETWEKVKAKEKRKDEYLPQGVPVPGFKNFRRGDSK